MSSLVPATFDLTGDNRICCGSVFAFSLSNLDAEGGAMFASMSAQIRKTASSTAVLASFECELVGNNWIFSLEGTATAEISATTPDNYWVWDAKGVTPDGLPVRVLEGQVEVDPSVTR